MQTSFCTGKRFYGPGASEEFARNCLCGRLQLPTAEGVEDPSARRLIESMILLEPRKRWTVQKALENATFRSADDSIRRQQGIQQARSNSLAHMQICCSL